jgi:hypothetical protein
MTIGQQGIEARFQWCDVVVSECITEDTKLIGEAGIWRACSTLGVCEIIMVMQKMLFGFLRYACGIAVTTQRGNESVMCKNRSKEVGKKIILKPVTMIASIRSWTVDLGIAMINESSTSAALYQLSYRGLRWWQWNLFCLYHLAKISSIRLWLAEGLPMNCRSSCTEALSSSSSATTTKVSTKVPEWSCFESNTE